MRNEVPDDNENVHNSVVARRNRRRKQAIAGAAGLAVLGAGAFLVTAQAGDNSTTEPKDTAALAQITQDAVTPPTSPSTMSASATPSMTTSASAKPSLSPTPRTNEQRVKAARSAAARASGQVRRPLAPANDGAKVAAKDIKVSVTGSVREDREELRLYSARQDLAGHKELAWVTDDYELQGDVRCTQKIRLSQNVPARERPTLLICWRTSSAKSVYTVAVKTDGRPSMAKSVAALQKEWMRLG